jgi:4-hydroxybenzoate polyprenyltransferase
MSASSPTAPRDALGGARAFGSLVAFSHTVFALPFAASAVVLALSVPHAPLTWGRALAMLGCMVSARTAAMAFNRYLDRHIDAKNPRTVGREIPAGVVSPRAALGLTLACCALFVALAAAISPACAALSPLVLVVLLGYSYTKRFTWAAHLVLGLALALAPGGAWIAMGAAPNVAIVSLMVAVLTWVAGFDVLYSLQDEGFDRKEGLHSIPARFGTLGAVAISAALHVVTVVAMAAAGALLGRGVAYFVGAGAVAALLVYEHAIVGRGNLERIDRAFFTVNGYVSVLFFALTLLDALRLG